MEKFSYISSRKITVGGREIPASDLTTLDAKTLNLAIEQKVIKKLKEDGKSKEQNSTSKERTGSSD